MRPLAPLLTDLQLAIFDFDGVIANTEYYHARAYQGLLRDQNITLTATDFLKYMGNSEREIWKLLQHDLGFRGDVAESTERRLRLFLTLVERDGVRPFSFIPKLLASLRGEGVPSVIVSSQKKWIIEMLLEKWKLQTEFSEIFSAADAPESKLDLLQQVPALYDATARRCLLLEDSEQTLKAARVLGFRTVAVRHSISPDKELPGDVTISTESANGECQS